MVKDIKEWKNMKKYAHKGLTRREIEVLCLMADGLTQKEIARQLFVSPNTINTHTRNIYEKTGARCSANAVYIMYYLIVSFRAQNAVD